MARKNGQEDADGFARKRSQLKTIRAEILGLLPCAASIAIQLIIGACATL